MNYEEELIFEIFKNFESDFKQYQSNSTGRIKKLFDMKKIKPTYLKTKTDVPKKHKEGFGEKKGDQLHGFVVMRYGTHNYYIGQYKDNQKEGFGYHHFVNKLVYRGKYENDKKIDGIVIDPETMHTVYEGSWARDMQNGKGTLTRKNQQKYIGDFNDGEFHGKGKMLWPNGDMYEGEFVTNCRQGYGKMIFANGDTYEGQFKNNKFHGKGKYVWYTGDVYEGEFVNGQMEKGDVKYSIGVIGSGVWSERKIDYYLEQDNVPNKMYYN